MLEPVYQKILYQPRPVSRRHPMAVAHRAKQFAPFAALRGFEETVRKKEIVYELRKDLSEEKKRELDMKLRFLTYGMMIQATYFVNNPEAPERGQYQTVKGKVKFFDASVHLRIDDTEIKVPDLFDVTGEIFERLETPC